MDFLTLERHEHRPATTGLDQAVAAHGLNNAFNPSLAVHAGATFVAFRAEASPGRKPFHAYVLRTDRDGGQQLIDLTERAADLGLPKIADPKLVRLGDDLFVTFNTGNVHHGQNDIYLQRISPVLSPPQRCMLERRRMVEKNWGFYALDDGVVRAIYTLAPLTILRLEAGTPGTDDDLAFVPELEALAPERFPRLHIGSQPLVLSSTRALIAANQQWPIPGLPRKIYFGRIAEVDLRARMLTRVSRRGLIHSWRSMLPQRKRHNPGLFSATYFSGMSVLDEDLVLSYGINDMSCGVARVSEDALWGKAPR